MINKVRSIRVDRELWKKAKIYCVKNDITLGEFITQILKKELKKRRVWQWLRLEP